MSGRTRLGVVNRWLAGLLERTLGPAALRLRLWDGSDRYSGTEPPIGALVVHDARTLRGLVTNPHLQFGEAYMRGSLDVHGELSRVVEAICRVTLFPSLWERIEVKLARANSLTLSRRNVHHHYDLGNDFYRGWLDDQLLYTCAYFERPDASLEEAQRAKMDLVCRKLQLRRGETVVEAGCGWGALALHMARHYGVRVMAFNVSAEQMKYARARAAQEGLSSQVEFIEDDYRNVIGEFDVFVSVGMLEHVGLKHFASLAEVLSRAVKRSGGRGLLHFIGRDVARPLNAWIRHRIFPGAYPPTLAEVATRIMTPAHMSVLDVENLRLHYARTLEHWGRRYATMEERVRSAYGEQFRRAWELYLAGSEASFAAGTLQLFQVLFAPVESLPPYWTRASVYADGHTGSERGAWTTASRS